MFGPKMQSPKAKGKHTKPKGNGSYKPLAILSKSKVQNPKSKGSKKIVQLPNHQTSLHSSFKNKMKNQTETLTSHISKK